MTEQELLQKVSLIDGLSKKINNIVGEADKTEILAKIDSLQTALNEKAKISDVYNKTDTISQIYDCIANKYSANNHFNLIENSTGENGRTDIWKNREDAVLIAQEFPDAPFPSLYGLGLSTVSTNSTYVYTNRFKVLPNTSYRFSCWVKKSSNTKGIVVEIRESNTEDCKYGACPSVSYTKRSTLVNSSSFGGTKWDYIEKTIVTGADSKSAYIIINNTGSSDGAESILWFGSLMFSQGNTRLLWNPNPRDYLSDPDKDKHVYNNKAYSNHDADGFNYHKNNTTYAYKKLFYSGIMQIPSSSAEKVLTITLPEIFKGEDFEPIFTLKKFGYDKTFYPIAHDINYESKDIAKGTIDFKSYFQVCNIQNGADIQYISYWISYYVIA